MIGGEFTAPVLAHLVPILLKYPFLSNVCLESVLVLHFLADKLEVTLYIPSLFKGLLTLVKLIFGDGKGGSSAKCSPEKGSKSPMPSSGVSPSNLKMEEFFKKISKVPKNADRSCEELNSILKTTLSKPISVIVEDSMGGNGTKGKLVLKGSFPGLGSINACVDARGSFYKAIRL